LIKLNRKDGKTLSFELDNAEDSANLSELLNDEKGMETITGIGCLHNTFWHALTKPKKFRSVRYSVEQLFGVKNGVKTAHGEKIVCQADDIQLTILVYYNVRPKMARVELRKIGKPRFVPKKGIKNGSNTKENK